MSDKHSTYKTTADESRRGADGQIPLARGERVSMRMWAERPGDKEDSALHSRDYEVVGYVIEGAATLEMEGDEISLRAGDSWCVPAGAKHRYRIEEAFRAVEAVSPAQRGK